MQPNVMLLKLSLIVFTPKFSEKYYLYKSNIETLYNSSKYLLHLSKI